MGDARIHKAICDVMQDIEAIAKDKRNQQQGFSFRGIDDVYNRMHPLMARHRIFVAPEVIEDRSEDRKTAKGGTLIYRILKIRYTFYADDGSSVSVVVMGEGMDSGDKASNKAMAVANKYALLQVFCIPTEDMPDPDAETQPESVPAKPERKMDAGRMQSLKAMHDKIMTWADERKDGMSKDQYAYIKGLREKAIDHYLQTGDEPTTWLSGGFAKIEARWIEAHPEDPSAPKDPDVPEDHEPDDAELAAEAEQELF